MDPASLSSLTSRQYSVKRLSEKFAAIRFREAASAAEDVLFENEAFAGVSSSNNSNNNNSSTAASSKDFVALR